MLFCEMLWEGVPVFVRRFDRTGFHPAFTLVALIRESVEET